MVPKLKRHHAKPPAPVHPTLLYPNLGLVLPCTMGQSWGRWVTQEQRSDTLLFFLKITVPTTVTMKLQALQLGMGQLKRGGNPAELSWFQKDHSRRMRRPVDRAHQQHPTSNSEVASLSKDSDWMRETCTPISL